METTTQSKSRFATGGDLAKEQRRRAASLHKRLARLGLTTEQHYELAERVTDDPHAGLSLAWLDEEEMDRVLDAAREEAKAEPSEFHLAASGTRWTYRGFACEEVSIAGQPFVSWRVPGHPNSHQTVMLTPGETPRCYAAEQIDAWLDRASKSDQPVRGDWNALGLAVRELAARYPKSAVEVAA